MSNFVYHSSPKQGLDIIYPCESTHQKSFVYGSFDIDITSIFLSSRGGDFVCSIGRDIVSYKPFICERFEGAFEYRYLETSGSIYILPSHLFEKNKTAWDEEFVSTTPISPLSEIKIYNIRKWVLDLEQCKKITIERFPKRNKSIPDDDNDLIQRAVIWTEQFGNQVLDEFQLFHPNLLSEVKSILNISN